LRAREGDSGLWLIPGGSGFDSSLVLRARDFSAMGTAPHAQSCCPLAISRGARLAAHINRSPWVSSARVVARLTSTRGGSTPVAMVVFFSFSCTPPSAVALQCHGHGASRAIALAFGRLTRRVSRRTQQQSTPVGHVRLFGRSASVDSGVSVPVAVFVDFSLSRAANCDGVSVPRARRLMRHHARLRGWSCHFWHL